MKLDVYNGSVKVKEVNYPFLSDKYSEGVVHQALVARLSHEREGNASTLTKSEVRGGGKKPWRQKGLGRARSGSTRSPLWRGGGVIFGPKPHDRDKGILKKQKSSALLSVFNKLTELGRVKVFEDIELKTHKTKDFIKAFEGLIENKKEKVVVITADYDKNMALASRNLQNFRVLYVTSLDLLPIIYTDRLLISEKAIEKLGTAFSGIKH